MSSSPIYTTQGRPTLAQAAAEQAEAAAIKAEMEAIDQMQRELDELWFLYHEAEGQMWEAQQRENELWDDP